MAVTPFFIGIDVSKASFDLSVLKNNEFIYHEKVDNSVDAIRNWFSRLKKDIGIKRSNSFFCMEHSGVYGNFLTDFLLKRKMNLWVESPLQIKKSLGIQRGKSDKIDSLKIARYCYFFQNNFKQWVIQRDEIKRLKSLGSLRKRILACKGQLSTILKENKTFLRKNNSDEIQSYCKESLQSLTHDLNAIDNAIKELINSDEKLHHLFEIITSVHAVGKVLAVEILIATNEFIYFDSPKKFACYCGVAPFENTSGESLQGKSKVSKIANRQVKAAMHMCAVTSLRGKNEFSDYYKRKIGEGKPKMMVLNAIKNKIVHRIFACVRDDRFYSKDQLYLFSNNKKHFEISQNPT